MEKIIVTLQHPGSGEHLETTLLGPVAAQLLDLDLPGVTINVRDAPVRDSLMTLTTLDPPVVATVSIWTHQYYGAPARAALDLLAGSAQCMAGYLVTESVPMPPPSTPPGERTPGLANIALLRRPAEMDELTWLTRWHRDHTPVAIATQSTFGYIQNHVVRPLTPDAPRVSAVVEEFFPIEAAGSLHAFFGAADDAELADRMGRMVTSTSAFGANTDVDTVGTGRYVFRTPFTSLG